MGLFRWKQGAVATAAAMSRFSSDERERGMDMLEAAEGAFVRLGAPSRLGTAMFSGFARGAGFEEDSPGWGVAAGASLMGYACRFANPAREVPDDIATAIEDALPVAPSGQIDYADDARLERLMGFTASLADDASAIATLADTSLGAWQAFATTATFQLHRNLLRNGLPKRELPSGATLENLLRLGYAVRIVDEIAGEVPADRSGEPLEDDNAGLMPVVPRADGPVPAEALDIESWLADATGVCSQDFEPYAERLLELGTLERLGIVTVFDALMGERPGQGVGDDVVTAISNARLGYALRNREIQLLDASNFVARDDAIAELLDERASDPERVNMAMLHAVLRDTLTFGFSGGLAGLRASTPGTTAEVRQAVIETWAERHYAGDDPRFGRDVTIDLMDYGYFLHRLFEIRPDLLQDGT